MILSLISRLIIILEVAWIQFTARREGVEEILVLT